VVTPRACDSAETYEEFIDRGCICSPYTYCTDSQYFQSFTLRTLRSRVELWQYLDHNSITGIAEKYQPGTTTSSLFGMQMLNAISLSLHRSQRCLAAQICRNSDDLLANLSLRLSSLDLGVAERWALVPTSARFVSVVALRTRGGNIVEVLHWYGNANVAAASCWRLLYSNRPFVGRLHYGF
jgi:hypothetical protein